MGKSQRMKGARGELEVAHAFQQAGFDAERSGFSQAQDAGREPDVTVKRVPVWIEVKRGGEGGRPQPALEQALLVAGTAAPLFVGRQDKKPWIASMYLEDYLRLLAKAYPEAVVQPALPGVNDGEK